MYERQEQTTFPGTQYSISRPALRGMEQPIQSFESFMRTVRPHPTPFPGNKPLPAIPSPRVEQKKTTSSPLSTALYRTTSWKAPDEWDEPSSAEQEPQISSFSVPRTYEPLIPEPSPGVGESLDSNLWPLTSSPTQHYYLESIDEQGTRPLPPSPYHSSYSSSTHVLGTENDCGFQAVSSKIDAQSPQLVSELTDHATSNNTDTEASSSSLLSENMSVPPKAATQAKALASLGIGTSGSKRKDARFWSESIKPPPAHNGEHAGPAMRGKRLQPIKYESFDVDDDPDESDLCERLQQLNVSQDYHNILADQYHDAHVLDSRAGNEDAEERDPEYVSTSNNQELMPRPLSWKKGPIGSYSNTPMKVTLATSDSDKRHRKMPSWVPFHQPTQWRNHTNLEDEQPRTKGHAEVETSHHDYSQGKSRFLHKDVYLSHLAPRVKRFRSNTADSTMSANGSIASLPPTLPPLEQPSPLFRLPGGLAVVRHSPSSLPSLQNPSVLDISPPLHTAQPDSHSDSPGLDNITTARRRSSLYRQQSEPPVAPGIAVTRPLRSSYSSPHSTRTRSSTSSPPTSPLAHEVAFPRTPPPPPPPPPRMERSPPTLSAWSQKDDDEVNDDRADSANEDEPHKRTLRIGIFDIARDARDSWKRHQRDVKHERLKQSIRVLGPTDQGVPVAHVKSRGQGSGDEAGKSGRLPGYMDGSPI